jgi:hypothetical protein
MQIASNWKRLLWHFDRSLHTHQAWKTLLWPLGLGAFLLLLFWLLGLLWPSSPLTLSTAGGVPRWAETTGLFFDAGNFPLRSRLPLLFQFLIVVVGSALLTAFLVATLTTILLNRRDNYRDGLSRYHFADHILVLGGSHTFIHLLKQLPEHPELQGKTWVFLTSGDAQSLRSLVNTSLPDNTRDLPFVIYHGDPTNPATLRSCQIELASVILITGEDNEPENDQRNIASWNALRHLRSNATHMAQCYLYIDHFVSGQMLRTLPQESHTSLETTVINRYESIARQTLISTSADAAHLTLDRYLLTPDSARYVHLVVVGMTPMGLAFAATAAQLCHYPNFSPHAPRPLRTRITFIDPQADEKIDLFKARYNNLFQLSHITFRTDANGWQSSRPDPAYGDFLDVEWAFLKGTVCQPWIRQQLLSIARDEQQVMSLAFCGDDPSRNLSDALCLPPQFYPINDPDDPAAITPVIFIYQPGIGTLAQSAQNEVPRYHNIVPFGMTDGTLDPFESALILTAKRVNYIHHKIDNGKTITSIPSEPQSLNNLWQQLSLAQKQQYIHAACILDSLMRNTKCHSANAESPVDNNALIDMLARIEHNRWNMEMLLDDYAPLPFNQRDLLNQALVCDDEQTRQEAAILNKRHANLRRTLKDIAPFDDLPAETRQHCRAIVELYHRAF